MKNILLAKAFLLSSIIGYTSAAPSGTITASAVFRDETLKSVNTSEDESWDAPACSVEIKNLAGYSGVFGPWYLACSENEGFGGILHEVGVNATELLIDNDNEVLTFSTPLGDVYECQLNGLGAGKGCNSWTQISAPAKRSPAEDISCRSPECGCPPAVEFTRPSVPENRVFVHLHKQITDEVYCPAWAQCTVTRSESVSSTTSWSATAALNEWISASFSVSESTTVGDSYSFTNRNPSAAWFCGWEVIPYVEYSVRNHRYQAIPCYESQVSGVIRVKSPEINGRKVWYPRKKPYCYYAGKSFWKAASDDGGF